MADLFPASFQTYSDCVEAMSLATLSGRTLAQCLGDEAALEVNNLVASRDAATKRDTPARVWWDCEPYHPAIARALRIDRKQTGGVYALAPFRLWNDGTRHLILAAYPCPRILGPIDMDHLGIEAVLAWNPLDDTAQILGEGDGLFGHTDDRPIDAFTLYASPRAFLTDWAINRAHAYVRLTTVRRNAWADAEDTDTPPGAVAIGPVEKINLTNLPREFAVQGFDPLAINKQIIRQARLPRAHAHTQRAAA